MVWVTELGGVILPQLSLGHYLPPAYNCSLPEAWQHTPITVPLADMLYGKALAEGSNVRFNMKNSYKDGAVVYVDSVQLV